ncbi:MAG: IS1595 family transposase [Holosporaceae bacterium]|jgi:transposase-like protein|nr:IS1595 family transposase [Holosporaceae bacterium]
MLKFSRLSQYKIGRIILCFCEDITANSASKLLKINRNTINLYYNYFRELIFQRNFGANSQDSGIFELDESYFGARRVRGKRGRGAAGKTPVFGLLKRDGKVFVNVVANCSREELMPIIQGKILEGSTIHTDGWKAYDGLVLNGYDHYRVFHSNNEFARGKSHVNGIEAFWSFAKRRLAKFNGLQDENFLKHLKECEFRYNNKDEDLVKILTKLVKKQKKMLV